MGANKVKTYKVEPIIKRPVIEINQEGTIYFTSAFINQLKYLCDQISTVEWSGLIFYSLEGSMQKLDSFIVTPYYIHLMHKGSAGATEFDDDGSMAKLYKAMPELDPFAGENKYFYGKIHSHNNMGVFHSSTDHQDLQDQAGKYDPYYLSVIVNNRLDLEAKIAFTAKIPAQKIKPTKFKGTVNWKLAEKEVLGIVDLDVATEENIITVSETLIARTEKVIKAAIPKPYSYKPPVTPVYGYNWEDKRQLKNLPAPKDNGSEEVPIDEFADQLTLEDFVGLDAEDIDTDINSYRIGYGQKSIVEFINTYFNKKYKTIEAFQVVDSLPQHAIDMMVKEVVPWFKKLTPWFAQNIVLYIVDEKTKNMGDGLTSIFEAIFALIKSDVGS